MLFDQLYYFSKVYEHRSISYAADVLHISRQALSQSIKNLENLLGVELFVRKKDGVEPTRAADLLMQSAKVILDEEAVIRRNMLSVQQSGSKSKTDRVAIAAPESWITHHGEALIQALINHFPDKDFDLVTIKNSDNEEFDRYDINILSRVIPQNRNTLKVSNNYYCRLLLKMPMYVWVRKGHPVLKEKEITHKTLRPWRLNVLKNSYNGKEVAKTINLDYDPIVEVPSILKRNMLRLNCYTFDTPVAKDKLIVGDLFEHDYRFEKLETEEYSWMYVIYKKKIDAAVISFVTKFVRASFGLR